MDNIDKTSLFNEISKIGEGFKILIKSRDGENELWDKFIYDQPYSSVHYSNQELEYQTLVHRGNGFKIIDLSIIFIFENNICGIWPISLKIDKDLKFEISSQGVTLLAPYISSNLNFKTQKKIINCSLEILKFLANKLKIKNVTSISTFTGNSKIDLWFYENYKRGVKIFPEIELLVNISLSLKEVQSYWSKSTNNDIKKSKKIWKYKIFENINKIEWDKFKDLHYLLAEKKTRSDESWISQITDINNRKAFVIYLYDLENNFVGGSFFRYTNKEAIYSSGVYKRELFDKPIGHYAQFLAINYMQSKKLNWYKIGHIGNVELTNKKEKNISSFKRKFATDKFYRFSFLHKF